MRRGERDAGTPEGLATARGLVHKTAIRAHNFESERLVPSILARMAGLTLVADNESAPAPRDDAREPAQALLDSLLDGKPAEPRARSGDGVPLPVLARRGEAVALLADLAEALADLAQGHRTRATVRLGHGPDAWELGLERAGSAVLVSVFHGGAVPEVLLHEKRIDGNELVSRVVSAMAAPYLGDDMRLACGSSRVTTAPSFALDPPPFVETEFVAVEPTGDAPIILSAEVQLRPAAPGIGAPPSVLRADVFALLFRGKIRVAVGDQSREVPDAFVFLVAEQLASMSLEAAEAWARGRPYYRRLVVGEAIVGLRLGSLGAAALTIGAPRKPGDARAQTWTFPAVDIATVVRGVVSFGRALTRSLVRRDRAQAQNLRLASFRAKIRELGERLRDATRTDAKINESPESYRAYAESVRKPASSDDGFSRTRLRFSARWMAAVPSIDLRATFLCGDRLIVGSARETSCVDGQTGVVMWKRPTQRAVAVITPLGLARLSPEGELSLLDIDSGEIRWIARLSPRVGSSASGAVVSAPGLPKMLIVSEGQRHLTALDLHAGEVRWRYAARRGATFRLRRAGKLVIVASGEHSLFALDALTGDVVWRFCDRLRFASTVSVDHDALLALAGDGVARGGTRLHHLDPWSGAARWSVDLPPNVAPVGAPLIAPETVIVATSSRRGTGLIAFDKRTGEPRFDQTVCTSAASCLAVDDTIVVNGEGGELVGVAAGDGATRYRHVFASAAEGDRPRRLEPILRSGALFVPQTEVHVIRPRDGAILGRVPNDIIPDLLRVDARCDVYVAEESGHVAAYGSGPRLQLV